MVIDPDFFVLSFFAIPPIVDTRPSQMALFLARKLFCSDEFFPRRLVSTNYFGPFMLVFFCCSWGHNHIAAGARTPYFPPQRRVLLFDFSIFPSSGVLTPPDVSFF